MLFKFLFAIAMAALLAHTHDARAGASLLVDDATTAPARRCQVEAWLRAYAPSQELTAVPACNLGGTEFGLSLSGYAGHSQDAIAGFGAKRLLHDFERDDWGLGLALGLNWNLSRARFDGWNLNLPASVALDPQRRTLLHFNLGWSEPRDARGAITGGVGLERALTRDWTALAEAYGDHRGGFAAQAGLRRRLGDDASLDLLIGHQRGLAHAPWLTLGVNVLLPN